MTTVRLDSLKANLPSPGIKVDFHGDPTEERPLLAPHLHHKRAPSVHREIKETLNAKSEYTEDGVDGRPHHVINQYVIKEEIGRGSYGAVHIATDQFGNEYVSSPVKNTVTHYQYTVKEFSKARLRKRAQSNILRLGPRGLNRRLPLAPGSGLGVHRTARLSDQHASEAKDALYLIREEIAIMKKLNHPNLVQLIEVLDDPEEDSLYMVLEMCKKGVVMKVGLDDPADPYPSETCRCWFRDLILGIEYLHAQGVVHRDIKPDNLLLTDDDVLKIVDFGVSEMFEKPDQMRTAKSAGSPAFLPPELCVGKHGDVSGTAADIWSMGVSLYCLRYGRIPFERNGVLDMYDAIRTDSVKLPEDEDPDFVDLMSKILEKDPDKRISMPELRQHPWVTRGGEDPMMSAEENCADPVDMPNALEVNHAFTRKIDHLFCVMKAIHKFKGLLAPKGPVARPHDSISRSKAKTAADHAAHIVRERERFLKASPSGRQQSVGEKGHAHDPTDVDPPFLGIGTGEQDAFASGDVPTADVLSDSPTAVHFNVYDRAFEEEVDKIKRSTSRKGRQGTGTTLYLTKHLRDEKKFKTMEDPDITWVGDGDDDDLDDGTGKSSAAEKFRLFTPRSGPSFADLVHGAVKDAKSKAQETAGVAQDESKPGSKLAES
ncbi:Pkinase-domain-containing protein [Coniochaeta ligniaria NRRL 30616]|uniref:Pkinase-domain-containing protein n=1 Tax=Coniochaeta ligniaria NRRL 30616 TaxID=1408157 RepID=A0A1J7JJ64_9PEZI|nr:Pkinase-domain-containing protein [Coniochaeta ligniaria NRRL 30616]